MNKILKKCIDSEHTFYTLVYFFYSVQPFVNNLFLNFFNLNPAFFQTSILYVHDVGKKKKNLHQENSSFSLYQEPPPPPPNPPPENPPPEELVP